MKIEVEYMSENIESDKLIYTYKHMNICSILYLYVMYLY